MRTESLSPLNLLLLPLPMLVPFTGCTPDMNGETGCGIVIESIAFDSDEYEGIDVAPIVTVDCGEGYDEYPDSISVHAYSLLTDPEGELIELSGTGTEGVYSGSIGFERPYSNTGYVGVTDDDNKVGVSADGWYGNAETVYAEFAPDGSGIPYITEAAYEESSSTVSGVVRDQADATVAGATVNLFNADSTVDFSVLSRENGVYAFYDIPSGYYTIRVMKEGFQLELVTVYVP